MMNKGKGSKLETFVNYCEHCVASEKDCITCHPTNYKSPHW